MRELAITAVGRDRPGIVAALTEALLPLGANLHDCRAALLRGAFAMVMSVAVPDETTTEQVREAMRVPGERLRLEVWVGEVPDEAPHTAGERCVVSVYGADHPGIVHAVSAALAAAGVNIVDLSSRVVGDPAVYILGVSAELPAGLGAEALETLLAPVAGTQRVELRVTPEADEVL